MKKVINFIVTYKRELINVVGGLLILYAFLLISTRKPQMPVEYRTVIDSLTRVNKALLVKQQQIDSTIKAYETQIDQIDFQVDNIKEKTTIVREYYHEVGQQIGQYTPTQVDSFFKARYKY